ncbi:MAG: helix-turn-helix transcriptional regulator [Eubacterium sp.]|nr:helix-turn-helix transcriptional regulator [Eubacterium sp.]
MFGDELKKARKALMINGKPITQERLGELFYNLADVSCSRQTIGYWENGINMPSMSNAILLSVFLNMPLDEIFRAELKNAREKYHTFLSQEIRPFIKGGGSMSQCKICGRVHDAALTEKLINAEFGDDSYDSCRSRGDLCDACSMAFLAGDFDNDDESSQFEERDEVEECPPQDRQEEGGGTTS